MDVWGATVCFNTVEAAKKNLPKPETWKDLTKPVYKGKIVMPNPASSGTGYLRRDRVAAAVGRDRTRWKYMDALHENIAQYTHSGTKPCDQAGSRRVPDRHLVRVPRQHDQGQGRADRPRLPEGRPGLGPRGVRHHEGHQEARRGEEARRLDVVEGRDGALRQELRDRSRCRASRSRSPNVPADYEKRLVKNDFAWAAKNRDKILAEWTKRYDVKSEPKK